MRLPTLRNLLIVLTVPALLWPLGLAAPAQEKSVRPGVNDDFRDPDVGAFVEKFERAGREIADKRKEIVAACKVKPGSVIADIGAGTGLFTRLFAPLVGTEGRVYAVDISKKFVDHIEKTCAEQGIKNVTGVVGTPTSVELPAGSIDIAFICDTYHHFEFPHKTMRSIHRALRPGGQVILVDFHRIEGKSSDWVMKHVRAGQQTFTNEIVAAGFKQVEEVKLLKESYCVRFEKVPADDADEPRGGDGRPNGKKLTE